MGGGVALLIRKDLKFSKLALREFVDGNKETLAIRVAFNNIWGNILLCYNPCKTIRREEFEYYFQQIPAPQLIIGDFNAHHRIWNPHITSREENTTGRNLFQTMIDRILISCQSRVCLQGSTPTQGGNLPLIYVLGQEFFPFLTPCILRIT